MIKPGLTTYETQCQQTAKQLQQLNTDVHLELGRILDEHQDRINALKLQYAVTLEEWLELGHPRQLINWEPAREARGLRAFIERRFRWIL